MAKYLLSPSKLSVLKDCPACFWRQEKLKIKQPRGIFPSLPGGMDRILKTHYDKCRSVGATPSEVEELGAELYKDSANLARWRNWRSGLSTVVDDVKLSGAIDDLIVFPDGLHSPYDYKTRGSAPKTDGSEYYGDQIDIYNLLLNENGIATNGKGYLCYLWPDAVGDDATAHQPVVFKKQTFQLVASSERARDLVKRAASVLDGPIPEPGTDKFTGDPCAYCTYAQGIAENTQSLV